jgi:hypothetical protein
MVSPMGEGFSEEEGCTCFATAAFQARNGDNPHVYFRPFSFGVFVFSSLNTSGFSATKVSIIAETLSFIVVPDIVHQAANFLFRSSSKLSITNRPI